MNLVTTRRGHKCPYLIVMYYRQTIQNKQSLLPKSTPGGIDLLITDVIMPEMDGRDLANNLKSINPRLKCIYMSGYTADTISQHGVLDDGVTFIQKPFTFPDLATKIREVLDDL